jgi:ferric iron reductase protein FhuF
VDARAAGSEGGLVLRQIDGVDASVLAVATDPLAPVHVTLAAAFPTNPPGGLVPGLTVTDGPGWICAQAIADGSRVPDLLAVVGRRRRASPHVAAALAWKAYTYALALPVVVGWAAARRVPLVRPADVLVRLHAPKSVVMLGLRPSIRVAVLPSDPLAAEHRRDLEVVTDEAALLDALRGSLLDAHLSPLLGHIRAAVRVGPRTLLGSLASGVAHAVLDTADALPGSAAEHAQRLLTALGVPDLVELVPGPDGGLAVQRHTCCLAFTLPEPKICAGCCIRLGRPVPDRRPFT